MTYRYTYKITCTNKNSALIGCYYLGKHTTNNMKDKYLGSSRILLQYLKEFPNCYKKEIIAYYNTDEELSNAEKELLLKHINDPYCINKTKASCGGSPDIDTRKKISNTLKGRIFTEEHKQHQKENAAKYWKGKHRTKKFKKQISDKFKDAKYMNDGYNQYLLKPEYWGEFIDIGYRFGRI